MKNQPDSTHDALQTVLAYHQATKHGFHHYARGPGYLDWDTQPDPFRRHAGVPVIPLEKTPAIDHVLYDDVFVPGRIAPVVLNRHSVSRLFFDSLAISAWKVAGNTRWALRVNPSSGNLHPTEAYLICGAVADLCDKPMVCHYAPKAHSLEVLATFDAALWDALRAAFPQHTVFVALSSIHWREAWKYGQRAYRYCQHDAGHAIAAIGLAAAGLGWQTKILDDLGTEQLALLTGTFREHDAEHEEPDVLLALYPSGEDRQETGLPEKAVMAFRSLDWQGIPNQLSVSHVDWGMDSIATATRKPGTMKQQEPLQHLPPPIHRATRPIAFRQTVHQRRSAVDMDGETRMSRDAFFRILQKTLPLPGAVPFNALPWKPHIHLALFVHRVDDLPPGLYCLVRDPSQQASLEAAFSRPHVWQRPVGCPEQLGLYCLIEADAQDAARQIACSQDIASDGCFSLGMIAEYQKPLAGHGPWFYPRLFWEAGMIGQVLYLEAEAAGLRGTGIGCYFDDPMHDILGLTGNQYQDLYHFTIGGPVEDNRLSTLPAYPG